MRKNFMKAFLLSTVIATSTIANIPMINTVQEVQASVGAVSNLKIKRTDKTKVTLTWDKDYSAIGYEVQMKTGKGSFKKYKTTKENALNISNLKTNTTYQFKVRSYEKNGKKTKYGSFSKKVSIKLNTSIYLTDLFEGKPNGYYIDLCTDSAFTMCDVGYAKGFHNHYGSADGIVYYINEDFSKLTFDWGTWQAKNVGFLTVYGDDEILYNGTNAEGARPETVTVDVTGVNRLTFALSETITNGSAYDGYTGVGNIKLTYN